MLTSCDSTDSSTEIEYETLRINHFKHECVGVDVFPCLMIKRSGDSDWTFFYDHIKGFNYEWGFLYELEVAISTVANPPADASSREYSMTSLNSKIQVPPGTLFEYSSIFAADQITLQANQNYSLFFWGEKEFTCNPADCLSLESLLNQQHSILFEFQHPNDNAAPLNLNRILCSDTPAAYRDTCL